MVTVGTTARLGGKDIRDVQKPNPKSNTRKSEHGRAQPNMFYGTVQPLIKNSTLHVMGRFVTLATCNLNQWALDFEGNKERIIESVIQAKSRGAMLRVGPELEVCGYGCLDHFAENDLYDHCWEIYAEILSHPDTRGIVLDIGMPVIHKSIKYNCRLISFDGTILLIRPKLYLANDGNYREMRFFTPWARPMYHEEYILPGIFEKVHGQQKCTFGDCLIQTLETRLGCETCEELFTPKSPHIAMSLDGVEIFTNSSGSHHELRKLNTRLQLIILATQKCGGIYLYSNQRGCDGDRLYYDGSACIVVNGKVVAQASQFSLCDVEVISASVDLNDVRSFRNQKLTSFQAVWRKRQKYMAIETTIKMSPMSHGFDPLVKPSKCQGIRYHSPQEEIALGPACWLWDYLRRSKCGGYFLPLSGGIDSCATAVIVHSMCRLVLQAIEVEKNEQVLRDLRTLTHDNSFYPALSQDIAAKLFYSSYMGTGNSLKDTRTRAKVLAKEIGAYHVDMNMDALVQAVISAFEVATGKRPIYKIFGGSSTENLALQNIQARLRMVLSYLFAQLLPWSRNISTGGLLVLGSANVDECLRGYLTKYDCSSADLNPIGGISKTDLKGFIAYAKQKFNMPILEEFLAATPSAELEPTTKDYVQSDELDMGMTYDELSQFGHLRKVEKCGPVSMYIKLYHLWSQPPFNLNASQVAEKVKKFSFFYAINRHKMTVMTPAYHAEQYSPDDNRFDLRPILINPRFPFASKKIDELVHYINESLQQVDGLDLTVD